MTTTVNDPSPSGEEPIAPPAPQVRPPRPAFAVSMLARRLHFLAGLSIAPFLAVLCLSGLAYAFTPQINDLFYAGEQSVTVQDGPVYPLSEQVRAALATRPADTLGSVVTPAAPDAATQVVLSEPGLDSAEARTVYVNPYTNHVTGDLVTVSGRPPAQQWLREFHGNLHLGEPGRLYSEFVASWLPFVVLGGLVLWIGQRRRAKRLRALFLPETGQQPGRARTRAWHGALGLWLAAGLLAVSVTGLTWSAYAGDRFDKAVAALDGKSPSLTAPPVTAPRGGQPISIDAALAIARAQGLKGAVTITPPAAEAKPFKVAETSDRLPIRKGSVAIDPYSGQVSARLGWPDYPLLAKLTALGIAAHSGTLLGLANQLVMALLALGTLVLLAFGYRMWWKRRPAGRRRAPAPPPVWRHLPWPVVAGAVVVVAAVGWAMPVFGVSLIAFIVLDGMIATVTRQRQPDSA
ncbi:PepSY domain-containing protein [Amycolatopsis sp. NBC_00345]|uniref:PepSY-associated TM helix domain-containing protein n=1 Tax=Amycolatopsis sp. NBC_00345 TaxID=2975955 RepID=UPI002E2580C6